MVTTLFTSKKTELVGLDVGSWAVKLVRLARHDRRYHLTAAASVEVERPETASLPDAGARTEAAIRECLQRAGIRERLAVCGVAGTEVMVRGFKFPPLPLKAVEQAILLEAQSVCPLDMKNSTMDYQLISSSPLGAAAWKQEPQPQSGVMVVGTERLVNQRVNQLTGAGIKPVLVDSEALALLNCLGELDLLRDYGTLSVIDIGYSKTSIIIYGQSGLPFVRDLNLGGAAIVRQIGAERSMNEQDVRQLLCRPDSTSTAKEQRNQLLLALNNAIRPLVMMINETLRFYSLQEKNALVEKIFLSGGFSLIPMFTDMLTDALPVETSVLNPLDHMDRRPGQEQTLPNSYGPALAIATGLAMRTL